MAIAENPFGMFVLEAAVLSDAWQQHNLDRAPICSYLREERLMGLSQRRTVITVVRAATIYPTL